MQKDYNEIQYENELLNNSLLFNAIRKNKTPEDKIRKIKQYLDRGANVNSTDANNKNNTPLHVAVLKEEIEVVTFLLEQGGSVTKKNNDHQTALDIANLSQTCKENNIVTTLEVYSNKQIQSSSKVKSREVIKDYSETGEECTTFNLTGSLVATNSENETRLTENEICSKQEPKNKGLKNIITSKVFQYQKRSGTSGLSGQLYETKLLSLILFRALYVQKVNKFLIATNVEGIGAFDDIIFRYNFGNAKKQRIMFIQAKHKDKPAKDKITVEEIMKTNGDFSLHKYLESYIKISQTFDLESNDDMFRGDFKNMDCDFIIYTAAIESFNKIKIVEQHDGQCFIKTNSGGKIFQFQYDDQDVEFLVQTVAKVRVELLAKKLSKLILRGNYSNMMADYLIKTYHVYLAQHVLVVESSDTKTQNDFMFARFRETFFTSNDKLLLDFRVAIYKEISLNKKNILSETQNEMENILKSLRFKVPVNFGNTNFCFSGSEHKQQRRLDYLCLKFKNLFDNADVTNVIKVDDNMVGPNEILQSTDLETYRLGGLVGNLLVLDDVTKTLKFNTDKDTLSEANLKLYDRIKQNVPIVKDISKFRFDIKLHYFPRLSILHDDYDKKLIKDFLNKLFFFTNQATEDEVENILKKEIDSCFFTRVPRKNDGLLRVKSDTIFLKVHDKIQKWWKQPHKAPYLTDSCEFFSQAEQETLNSPLLSILNFTYIKTLKNILTELKFRDTAVGSLELDQFFNSSNSILNIISEENTFSCIKVIQYFKENNYNNYTFINMDYIRTGNYIEDIKAELKESKINILILVCKKGIADEIYFEIIKTFKGKIILISNYNLTHQFSSLSEVWIEKVLKTFDTKINFMDLTDSVRNILLKEINIVFQGKPVPLGILFKEQTYNFLNSNVLYQIINNVEIKIGNSFNTPSYDEILDFYISEKLCRFIVLQQDGLEIADVLKYNEISHDFNPDKRDIVLITDKYEEFAEIKKKYQQCNVHWFYGEEYLVWRESRGNLANISKHIQRGEHEAYTLKPLTLKDLQEKIVIISAEPGMGKSSLLTHLAIQTKEAYPTLWISKINLLENINVFSKWKENNVHIDLKEAIKFLFRSIAFKTCKELQGNQVELDRLIEQVSLIDNDISFNTNNKLNLMGLNLVEIQLFIYSFNNGQVAILLDGFDEICPDFVTEFITFVKILKTSKVAHLWVTSRLYNVLNQLENALETFSFTIQPFTYNDQLEFLDRVWSRKLGPKKLEEHPFKMWGIRHVIKCFLSVLSAVLCDSKNKFISIPLHLYMISETYQDSFNNFPVIPESITYFIRKQNTMNKVNLNQIYERFVDAKFFKIRFGEKKPFLCINDPDMRKLIDTERKAFFHIHKKIAAHVVFRKKVAFFEEYDVIEICDYIDKITAGEEKTGIIAEVVQNEPKFVHFSFAEYFATEFLCDRIESLQCGISLRMILLSAEEGVRRFFNARLGNHPNMFDYISKTDELNLVFKTLLSQGHNLRKILFTAFNEFLENIALLLLKCIRKLLTKDNLNDFIDIIAKNNTNSCVLCIAVENSAMIAVNFIIELIKDIDDTKLADLFHCSDLPEYNPIILALGRARYLNPNLEMLDVLLLRLSASAIVDIFTIQFDSVRYNISSQKFIHLIYWALDDKQFDCFNRALKTLNKEQLVYIFIAKDPNGKLAAHFAAEKQCYVFFDKLDLLLGRNQFKEICMNVDNSGLTPIHYFNYKKAESDKLKTILDKVYESDTNAKLTFDYFISKHKD